MIRIEDFWQIDDEIKARYGKKFYEHIDYCGLEPIRPLENDDYFCTPRNSLTFACTGGDGVHYGFMDGFNLNGDRGPIVITVPMAEHNNVVVAEDLGEFFSLGYHVGWFAMEQIVYDLDWAIEHYSDPEEEVTREANNFLELIRDAFSIQHTPLSIKRLAELESKYYHQLDIRDIDGQPVMDRPNYF